MKDFRFGNVSLVSLVLLLLLAEPACHKSEESSGPPATGEQASRVIDLSQFPLMPGAGANPLRSLAAVTYEIAGGNVKAVFEAQRDELKHAGWKETKTDTSVTDQSATGTFRKEGFVLSLSAFSASPGKVTLSLINHGNINYDRLPRPAGMKPIYVGAVSAIYVGDASLPETTQAVRKMLIDSGWQTYGQAGDTTWFKQNAIRLSATVASAPAQGNKTTLSYSSELMSADLPAPENAQEIRYADPTKELSFETAAGKDEVVAFYKKSLGTKQWAPTLEKTVEIDGKPTMIFRNPSKDMITLSFSAPRDARVPVSVQFQSAAEIAEMEQRIRAKLSASPR